MSYCPNTSGSNVQKKVIKIFLKKRFLSVKAAMSCCCHFSKKRKKFNLKVFSRGDIRVKDRAISFRRQKFTVKPDEGNHIKEGGSSYRVEGVLF